MPLADDPAVNLANLPSDIIRTIIRARHEFVDRMQLISKRWNNLAIAHLKVRKYLPIIASVACRIAVHDNCVLSEYRPKFVIAEKYIDYFGMSKWHKSKCDNDTKEEAIDVLLAEGNVHRDLSHIFSRCSRIKRLDPGYLLGDVLAIKDSLKGVLVDEFALNFADYINGSRSSSFINFINIVNVQQVRIDIGGVNEARASDDYKTFFVNTFIHVPSIQICTLASPNINIVQERAEWEQRMNDFVGHGKSTTRVFLTKNPGEYHARLFIFVERN